MTEPLEGNTMGALEPTTVLTKQQRIAHLAGESAQRVFTSLAHHIDEDWLAEAYRKTRKDGAVGVDGQTAQSYGANLDGQLADLLERAKSGRYRAPPLKRVHIPKGGGRGTRPIGIPTFEDKVLQRAIAMVLEPIYEQDFLDCSYGYRPNRSAHQALSTLHRQLTALGGGWVIELDIRAFFDTLDPTHLRAMLRQRVNDGVLTRLIGKWLKAGVLEEGQVHRMNAGTPQGGVLSPLLANLYLHTVLDVWFEREIKPQLIGRSFMVRFADDAVLGFSNEHDARRVFSALSGRFAQYGLRLHPTKTRLLRFRPPRGDAPRATFDFLGFTHYWEKSRRGRWSIQRKTARSRLRRALADISAWCRAHRHLRLAEQQVQLSHKLRGHYAYFGISGNIRSLQRLRFYTERLWMKWLSRRSQRGRLAWERVAHVLARFPLPTPRLVVR